MLGCMILRLHHKLMTRDQSPVMNEYICMSYLVNTTVVRLLYTQKLGIVCSIRKLYSLQFLHKKICLAQLVHFMVR